MSRTRLFLFLSDVEGSIAALRHTLTTACEHAGLPTPEVRWAEHALPLADAGWRVAELQPPEPQGSQRPDVVNILTRATARDFRCQAVGLAADRTASSARAATSEPERSSRSFEGEYLDVLRHVARWLGVEPALVGRLLSAGVARNQLAGPVDFGGGISAATHSPPSEPDEDDRYVESRLAEARRLMAVYRAQRK